MTSFQIPGVKVQEYYEKMKDDPVFVEILEILEDNQWSNRHQAVAMMVYLDNALCWETTCVRCAYLLDQLYRQECELDRIKNGREDSQEGQEAQPL